MSRSLDELARQHDVQILYPSVEVVDLQAPAVEGDFDTAEVVGQLLVGTGLDFSMRDRSIAVFRAVPATAMPAEAPPADPVEPIAPTPALREELIVTALRRETVLDRIPRTVQVTSAAVLQQHGISRSGEIDPLSPGLEIGPNALGNPSISLRGIGTNEASDSDIVPNSVAVYVDDVYQGSPVMNSFLLFDLDRIELLKGPQGTLYGRNSTTGAINYVTRRPADEFGGRVAADYGRFSEFNGEAAVNLPLSEALRMRLAVARQTGGANYRFGGGGDYGAADRSGVRLQAVWEPVEPLGISLLLQHDTDRSELAPGTPFGEIEIAQPDPYYCEDHYFPSGAECTTGFGGVTGRDDLWRIDSNLPPAVDLSRDTIINRVHYDFGALRLTGINAFQTLQQEASADRDGTAVMRTQEFRTTDLTQQSSEWQLSQSGDRVVDWLAGVYLSRSRIDNNRVFQNLSDMEIHFNSESRGSSGALYAHLLVELSETLELSTGARYTREQRELFAESASVPINAGIPFDAVSGLSELGAQYFLLPDGGERRSADWDNLSGELGLRWHMRSNMTLFGSISSGFKSGGYSGSFTISTSPPGTENRFEPYKPERTVQTELGARGTLLGDSLRYEVAAFHVDLRDRVEQVLVYDSGSVNGNASRLVNAARAEIDGLDFNFAWAPARYTEIQAALAWMDARYTRYLVNPADPDNQLARDSNRSGYRLPQAPEWSGILSFTQRVPLNQWGELSFGASAEHTGSQFFNSRNARSVGQPAYTLLNLHLSWQSADGKTAVGTYIDNVTDEKYAVYGTDAVDGVSLLTAGRQRSWRVNVSYLF